MSSSVHVLGHLTNQLGTVLGAGGFCHDCFDVDGASSTVEGDSNETVGKPRVY